MNEIKNISVILAILQFSFCLILILILNRTIYSESSIGIFWTYDQKFEQI